MVVFNGTPYSYMKNLQGDIVAILDSNGTAVVQYKYDAWGKPISKTGSMASTLGTVQPFRYRGYVYDEETGLFYLKSRYYSSEWLRFVNADMLLQPNFNLFAYCSQNPTNRFDPDGATDFCTADWEMMSNRSLLSPYNLSSIAGGFKGNTTNIWSGYEVRSHSMAYEERWISSHYNNSGSPHFVVSNMHITRGTGDAPKTSTYPGETYLKVDNEDNSVIVSKTQYGNNCLTLIRDDYYVGSKPHTHNGLLNHRHIYFHVYRNGQWYVNKGPVIQIPSMEEGVVQK